MKIAFKLLLDKYKYPLLLTMLAIVIENIFSFVINNMDSNISYWRSLDHIDIQFIGYLLTIYFLLPLLLSVHAGVFNVGNKRVLNFGFKFGFLINLIISIFGIPFGLGLIYPFIKAEEYVQNRVVLIFITLVLFGMFLYTLLLAILGGFFGWLGFNISVLIRNRSVN